MHVDITIVGFAPRNPPDPRVTPNPTPTIPFNAYGCQTLAAVGADAVPDETSTQITVCVSDVVLELEYQRDRTPARAEVGGGTGSGEAYLLTSLTVTAGLALEHACVCIQASIAPGSVQVVLADKAHGFLSDDCLDLCPDHLREGRSATPADRTGEKAFTLRPEWHIISPSHRYAVVENVPFARAAVRRWRRATIRTGGTPC